MASTGGRMSAGGLTEPSATWPFPSKPPQPAGYLPRKDGPPGVPIHSGHTGSVWLPVLVLLPIRRSAPSSHGSLASGNGFPDVGSWRSCRPRERIQPGALAAVKQARHRPAHGVPPAIAAQRGALLARARRAAGSQHQAAALLSGHALPARFRHHRRGLQLLLVHGRCSTAWGAA